ncbi:hypothetical protein CN234_34895 [Sinorhizobium meliloti]|nr:hypothetical protein CN234_34895 [Sinorhizobium meliloti]
MASGSSTDETGPPHRIPDSPQRHRLSWERFQRLLRKYLPPCRLMHPHPDARLTVTTSDRSRMR